MAVTRNHHIQHPQPPNRVTHTVGSVYGGPGPDQQQARHSIVSLRRQVQRRCASLCPRLQRCSHPGHFTDVC